MNFILHSVAAHQRLTTRPEARPQHVSLYWALFYQWNAARFPAALDLDHQATMRAARIGNEKTYRATLYDLTAWGLIDYVPSQSRHEKSRCYLTNLSGADVPPVNPSATGRTAPGKTSVSGAETPEALRAKVPSAEGVSGAEVPEDTFYSKTGSGNSGVVNGGAAPHKKKVVVLEGKGLSGVELLPPDDTPTPNGAGPVQPAASHAPRRKRGAAAKKDGVAPPAATIRAAATAPPGDARRPGRSTLPELPFSQSPIADVSAFMQAFQGTDYELADLRHYHQLVATWRDRKTGEEPRRKDWVATAKRFMLNDAADNRLKLAPAHQRHHAGPADSDPGAFFARTGYRSKYDT